MKEFLSEDPTSFKGILRKNYIRGQYGSKVRKMRNETADSEYRRILDNVKKLYSQLPDAAMKTVYERNWRNDQTCLETMHNFIAPTFLFNLSCDFDNKCWITYAFHNCPFEQEIKRMLTESCWSCMKEFTTLSGFPTYYQNVMRVQKAEYIQTL